MNHLKQTRFNFLRSLALLTVTTFGLGSIIATGGGGGDENGLTDDDIIPRGIYNYRLASGLTSQTGGDPLTISLTFDNQPMTVSIIHADGTSPGIHGTYMTSGGYQVLVEEDTTMIVEDLSLPPVIGNYTLDVSDFLFYENDPDNPFLKFGAIQITPEDDPAPNPVIVTFIDDDPLDDVPDVQVMTDTSTDQLTWEEFAAFEDSATATDEQELALFAVNNLLFMLELLDVSADALETIFDEKDVLLNQAVVDTCDAFASQALSAPTGISDVGSMTISWQDDNSSGSINTGDSFNWVLADCWENDATDTTDELLNGEIDTTGYIQVINSAGLIETTGFEPNGVDPGGVIFSNFMIAETNSENNPPTIEESIILNGGFSILFN